jgi:hypothetical protein
MQDAIDPSGRNGGAGQSGEQYATKRVSERMRKTALERFDVEMREVIADFDRLHGRLDLGFGLS